GAYGRGRQPREPAPRRRVVPPLPRDVEPLRNRLNKLRRCRVQSRTTAAREETTTMTNNKQQVPRSWLVASLAFAFLVGVSLSIPLLHGMSLSPTGYDQAVVASQQAQSVIEKNVA